MHVAARRALLPAVCLLVLAFGSCGMTSDYHGEQIRDPQAREEYDQAYMKQNGWLFAGSCIWRGLECLSTPGPGHQAEERAKVQLDTYYDGRGMR